MPAVRQILRFRHEFFLFLRPDPLRALLDLFQDPNVMKEVKDRWRSPDNPGAGLYGKTTSGTSRERDLLCLSFASSTSPLVVAANALTWPPAAVALTI